MDAEGQSSHISAESEPINPLDIKVELTEFIALLDPYRFSEPVLGLSHDNVHDLVASHKFHASLPQVRQQVDQVLSRYGILTQSISIRSFTAIIHPEGVENHPIVCIVPQDDGGNTSSWKFAAKELYDIFGEHYKDRPFVLIYDPQKMWNPRLGAILNDQAVDDNWSRVEEDVIEVLDGTLDNGEADWSRLCVYMRPDRSPSQQMTPTIFVRCVYPATANWFRVTEAINQTLANHNVSGLNIEFDYCGLKQTSLACCQRDSQRL